MSCQLNNLTNLDVSNNTVLEILNCDENDLTTLNLPTTNTLTGLLCRDNKFVTLDFSNQEALEILLVGNNANLETLNIKNGNNTSLTQFNATTNTTNLSCIVVDDASNVPSVITNGTPAGVNFTDNPASCATLSVNDEVLIENTIAVYPNPSSDKIFIKNSSNATLTNVKLFNLLGSLVQQTNVTEEIDITRLPTGIYMMFIATDTGNVFTKRIIKQ